jgi:hypothetical protein
MSTPKTAPAIHPILAGFITAYDAKLILRQGPLPHIQEALLADKHNLPILFHTKDGQKSARAVGTSSAEAASKLIDKVKYATVQP